VTNIEEPTANCQPGHAKANPALNGLHHIYDHLPLRLQQLLNADPDQVRGLKIIVHMALALANL
jgi:hypothetical protein